MSAKVPTSAQVRRQFIDFFVKHYGHKEIPSASIVPENDPTVLFTTAGMHPLVPFLMGEKHPSGTRLVDAQKCVRTDDIDEVGDATHCTFFEMMGNWSLGDYFKEQAIEMSYRLLTTPWEKGGFGFDIKYLSVSCFEGDSDAPRDTESAEIWKKYGIPEERIFFYNKKKNWWGPAG
ncbi:MAG: alanine--tRNA ligase-related protein, partial [Patescibacteria group bacterium]